LLTLVVRRRFWLGLGLLAVLGAGPWLAYHSLNSVRQRVEITRIFHIHFGLMLALAAFFWLPAQSDSPT
ncbi:hypothetical protein, partial [Hymenobacter glacialis]|uniref:hypothetical protein n=1 Tax=Hymenobacter glacialis TaxID=1908236 RepID=UPI0019D3702E